MFRRRAPHPSLPAFDAVLEEVERAKALLVAAVPAGRAAPRLSPAEALLGFEEALRSATARMAAWRPAAPPAHWAACAGALERCLRGAERLRLEAPALDFEGLVTVLGDLMSPLDAFDEARRALAGRA